MMWLHYQIASNLSRHKEDLGVMGQKAGKEGGAGTPLPAAARTECAPYRPTLTDYTYFYLLIKQPVERKTVAPTDGIIQETNGFAPPYRLLRRALHFHIWD
jgi:hypothetical protein